MLVLSVNLGRSVVIGDSVIVSVQRPWRGGSILRIGVEAPRDIVVLRDELVPPSHPLFPAIQAQLSQKKRTR